MTLLTIEAAIAALRADGRTVVPTTDVRRVLTGRYVCDVGVDVAHSPNAAFGRNLALRAAALGIQRIELGRSARDDLGRRTHCAMWRIGP